MADSRKITIEILSTDDDGKEKKTKSPEDNVKKTINKIFHPLKNTEDQILAKHLIASYALQNAKKIIIQTTDATLNRYFTLTENYISQNNYQNIKNSYGKVVSIASSIAGGALTGAKVGGGTGAIFGGIAGAVFWGAGEYVQNTANLSGYYQDLNAANFNYQFNRMRKGLTDEGRGTEN